MKTLDINERFDKEFPDPMEEKYGKGFVLYCSLCSKKGDMRDRIKAFIKQELDVQLEEIKKSFVEEFYQAGGLWLPYSLEDKEEEENAMDSVLAYWQSIIDRINKK